MTVSITNEELITILNALERSNENYDEYLDSGWCCKEERTEVKSIISDEKKVMKKIERWIRKGTTNGSKVQAQTA